MSSGGLHSTATNSRPNAPWRPIGIATAVVFLLGWLGFALYARDNHLHSSNLSAAYHALQLFILHTPHLEGHINWALELARWSAPVVSGWATMVGVFALFRKEIRLLKLPRQTGHVVICGLGRRGLELVRCFVEHDREVVAIEQAGLSDAVQEAEAHGAVVVVGNVTDAATLERARVTQAEMVVAICGEDGTNVEIGVRLGRLVSRPDLRRTSPLKCYVQLTDVALRDSFQRTSVLEQKTSACRIHFFDIYQSHVRSLLEEVPLDRAGIHRRDAQSVHLVILGLGRMGETLAVRAAQLGHFANRSRLRISVIDRTANLKRDRLLFRYPALPGQCKLEFHALEIESPTARDLLQQWCQDPQSLTTIAICFDDDCRSVDIAFRLGSLLRDSGAPIAVRLSSPSGLATLLTDPSIQSDQGARLHPFGTVKDGQCERAFEDEEQDVLAQAIHEDFVRKRTTPDRTPETDQALRPWDEQPHVYRDSNRQQADHLNIKLRAVDCEAVPVGDPRPAAEFTLDEVEILAEMEHARWVAERSLAGWTLAPQPKDDLRRTSPHLVTWDQLKDDVKQYDRDAVLNIPNILKSVSKKMVRE